MSIAEMNCPYCNAPDAYVGLTTVECKNTDCKAFLKPEEEETRETEKTKPQYFWVTHHYDFG